MDDLWRRTDSGWESWGGGGGGGIIWTSHTGPGEPCGVLRYGGEAPKGAQVAVVDYEGETYRVPVRHGQFLLVVWDTPYSESPTIVEFE